MTLLIGGTWRKGSGTPFTSIDPASGGIVWKEPAADAADCAAALAAARHALPAWRRTPLDERLAVARAYATELERSKDALAELISRETGKLLWESEAEVASMIGKVAVSITAQAERAGERHSDMPFGRAVLRHHGHGVLAVLGPYNFPGHLPNGHIVPAVIAGNAVVFKPSEIAPAVGEAMAKAWQAAGLPDGILNLVQGGRETGAAIIAGDIDGLLFTGSAAAGAAFRRAFVDRPEVTLALELGGNNPLVVWDSPEAAASIIVHSAFITTGQRCSCARRLIVPSGAAGDAIIDALVALTRQLPIGAWGDGPAFMGPLVSDAAAHTARKAVAALEAQGARAILPSTEIEGRTDAFMTPAILDVTGHGMPDEEIFAPVLQVTRVPDFDAAIAAANATRFGLSAGLVSADGALWARFLDESRAGIVNWNRPTTGAAANMPFGGLGASGNHRPSAYYAADYVAYPIGSFEADLPTPIPVPGMT